MNWNQFLLSLAVFYLLYYGLNVLFDLLRSARSHQMDEAGELVFSEETTPRNAADISDPPPDTRGVLSAGLLQSTGAVSIQQLFALAQSDLIEYTKAIPY